MEWLLGVALVLDAMFLLAVFVKWRQVRIAKSWLPASGQIISSKGEAGMMEKIGSRTSGPWIRNEELRNFAAIIYEFRVGGTKYSGNRVSIGEDPGNFLVAEKLKQYPRRAKVTVFYDPANPANCVLERDPPNENFFRSAFSTGAVFAVVVGTLILAANDAFLAISRRLTDLPSTPRSAFAICLVLLAGLLAVAAFQQYRIILGWRKVTGRIASSSTVNLEQPKRWLSSNPTYFRPRIVYSYTVEGTDYQSDRVSFGDLSFTSSRGTAEDDASRFKPDDLVEVHYDPASPASAVLEPGGRRFSFCASERQRSCWSWPHMSQALYERDPTERGRLMARTMLVMRRQG